MVKKTRKKIIITGMEGQIGMECCKVFNSKDFEVLPFSRQNLDITDNRKVERVLLKVNPAWIINCAAVTNVDACENNPEVAFTVNCQGSLNLALSCAKIKNCKMIYISTNAVFDGLGRKTVYTERDQPTPQTIGVYAKSKLAGELATQAILKERAIIVRTSWVYGEYGKRNFVKTVISLSKKNIPLEIVTDEIATPTWARSFAQGLEQLMRKNVNGGVYHLTNEGYTSRYGFAKAILDISNPIKKDLLRKTTLSVYLASNPRPCPVPVFTPVENIRAKKLGVVLPAWERSLREYLLSPR